MTDPMTPRGETGNDFGVRPTDEGSAPLMAYAWPPRPSAMRSIGAHHIVVSERVDVGRLHREPGEPLCKPGRRFWGLDVHEGEKRRRDGQKFDCQMCCARNERLNLVGAEEIADTSSRMRWA